MDYPEELHDIHNDYSMAPEKIKIEDEMLSPYSFQIKRKSDIKSGGINTKFNVKKELWGSL